MAIRKTQEQFDNEVKQANPSLLVIGIYKNARSKVHCKCKICGYEWKSNASNLITYTRCLNCMRLERIFEYPNISHEEFVELVHKNYPELIVRGIYKYGLKIITCECSKCGYISRIRTQMLLEHTYECKICKDGKENIKIGFNDIKTINPVMYECLKNKNDNETFSINSRAKTDFICPSCGKIIKNKTIDRINRRGLKCKCQDGNSLGEKYFYQVIKSVDGNVECEKYLNNNQSFRYDFYGNYNGIKWICEIQGKQHYTKSFETCGGRTLQEEKENDKAKMSYALDNGIDLYVSVDSKDSGFNQLKSAILNSELSNIYDFSNVDWVKCYRNSLMSDVLAVCKLWNTGNKVMEICNILGIDKGTVRRYLTRCNEIGLCTYDHTQNNKMKVICVDTGEIFNCLRDAEKKYNIKCGYLSGYLKGNLNISSVANKQWKYLKSTTSSEVSA